MPSYYRRPRAGYLLEVPNVIGSPPAKGQTNTAEQRHQRPVSALDFPVIPPTDSSHRRIQPLRKNWQTSTQAQALIACFLCSRFASLAHQTIAFCPGTVGMSHR